MTDPVAITPERQALADIQGNVAAPFAKDHQIMLLLHMTDAAQAKVWLGLMAEDVATSDEVFRFNELFKLVRARRHDHREVVEATWTQLLLTASGMRFIGVPDTDLQQLGAEFARGMKAQAASLGDTNESDPSKWIDPYRVDDIHAMVIVASDDADDLDVEVNHIVHEAEQHGVRELGRELGETLDGALRGHEHFGFKDGMSQPAIANVDPAPAPGAPAAVPLGEFVLGWADINGTVRPVPTWAQNGSLAAFRRLRQDVPSFRQFVGSTSATVSETPELLGAQLVGRWASGAPLALAPAADDPALAADDTRNNSFDYANDADGTATPRFAHIRKVAPRAEAPIPPAGESQRRRILRRGIPYGPQLDDAAADDAGQDRGLLFLCFQSDLQQQFQFIQQAWANDPNFPTGPQAPVGGYNPTAGSAADGPDPIIGEHHGTGVDNLQRQGQAAQPLQLTSQFVTVTGGEYFFAPSLTALRTWAAS